MKLSSTSVVSSVSGSFTELLAWDDILSELVRFVISLTLKSTEGLFLDSHGIPRMASYRPREKTVKGWVSPNSPTTNFSGAVRRSFCVTLLPSAKVTENSFSELVVSSLCFSTKSWAIKSWEAPESTRKTAFFPASLPVKRSRSCCRAVSTPRLLISDWRFSCSCVFLPRFSSATVGLVEAVAAGESGKEKKELIDPLHLGWVVRTPLQVPSSMNSNLERFSLSRCRKYTRVGRFLQATTRPSSLGWDRYGCGSTGGWDPPWSTTLWRF